MSVTNSTNDGSNHHDFEFPGQYVEPSYCSWCKYRGKDPNDVNQHILNRHRHIPKPRYSCAKCFEKGYENQYKYGENTFLEYIHINKNSVKRCFCGWKFASSVGISGILNDMASEEFWPPMNSSVLEDEEERRKNI